MATQRHHHRYVPDGTVRGPVSLILFSVVLGAFSMGRVGVSACFVVVLVMLGAGGTQAQQCVVSEAWLTGLIKFCRRTKKKSVCGSNRPEGVAFLSGLLQHCTPRSCNVLL